MADTARSRASDQPDRFTSASKRGPYAAGIRRREQIVDAAITAFGALGYNKATMKQIAQACNVTRTGLGHYFESKEALLEAVLVERDHRNHAYMERSGAGEQDGLRYFSHLVQVVRKNAATPGIVNLFAVLSSESTDTGHPAHAYFKERYATTHATISAALQQLRDCGVLRAATDIGDLAIEIIALLDGLQVQWLYSPDTVDMAELLRGRLEEMIGQSLLSARGSSPDQG